MLLCAITLGAITSCDDKEEEKNKPNISVESKSLTFTGQEQTQEVTVTTNQATWDATSNQTWCTVVKETNKFKVTVAANTTVDERTATITISAGDASNVTIEIKQAGAAHTLSVSPNEPIVFSKNGGVADAQTITVATNVSTWNAVSDQTWCTVTKGTNEFTVTAAANTTTNERTATITVSAGNASKMIIAVTQLGIVPELSVSTNETIIFTKDGDAYDMQTITVSTNQPSWDATSDVAWCTVDKGTDQFTIIVQPFEYNNSSRTAAIRVTAGDAPTVTMSVRQSSIPVFTIVAGSPITEFIYKNGFFNGSRINFNLNVTETMGCTSISIWDHVIGAPYGFYNSFYGAEKKISISGPGTYRVSRDIKNGNPYATDRYNDFTYIVESGSISYTVKYTGNHNNYTGQWQHIIE